MKEQQKGAGGGGATAIVTCTACTGRPSAKAGPAVHPRYLPPLAFKYLLATLQGIFSYFLCLFLPSFIKGLPGPFLSFSRWATGVGRITDW